MRFNIDACLDLQHFLAVLVDQNSLAWVKKKEIFEIIFQNKGKVSFEKLKKEVKLLVLKKHESEKCCKPIL